MLNNLYKLGSELLKQNRRLHVFYITYNKIHCNVIFHRLIKPNGYYPIQLDFIKVCNNQSLCCYANKSSTNLKFNDFCNFFNINSNDRSATIREIFVSFYETFNSQIPTTITPINDSQRNIMSKYIIAHSSATEATKVYLYDFRLNNGERSKYNNDKAAALYPDIYEYFKNDTDHSFFFSPNKSDEITLNQLLEKLRKRSS